jgi:NhaA family Na+:H+ antiporter
VTEGGPPRPRAPWARSQRPVPRRILQPLQEFLHLEASGGLVLLAATVAALVWANVAPGPYEELWTTEVSLRLGDYGLTDDLRHIANDGLMAIFFLVVGLEVKRELVTGELSTRQAALLPAFAAVGGMVVPAVIFLATLEGGDGSRGWGIPMATDVAFALGALLALGRRVPAALLAFLLGVAVIDDIGAILVVAVYYTDAVQLAWLGAALGCLALIVALQRIHVRYVGVYVVLGAATWLATYESGVHATIAGVALGLLTPVRPFQQPSIVSGEAVRIAELTADEPEDPDEDASHWRQLAWLSKEAISPLARIEHGLHQWSSFVVLPTFALANAGIVLDGDSLSTAAQSRVALGIVLGLVLGKTIGLVLGAALATRLGVTVLPPGVRWAHVVGLGALAGIGFTVSLFITELAYATPEVTDAAKIGVLVGSAIAATVGVVTLLRAGRAESG